MSQKLLSFSIVLAGFLTPCFANQQKKSSSELQGLYIVRESISDAGPFWFDYILNVSPGDAGLKVSYIRISPLKAWCRQTVTVKAATALLKHESMADIVGRGNPCLMDEADFVRSLNNSKKPGMTSLFDTFRFNVVANCGSRERVFHFPYPEEINVKRLKRSLPRAMAVWYLESRIVNKAFGKGSVFYDVSEQKDLELSHAGEELVPELVTGKYDKGFSDYCAHQATEERPSGESAARCTSDPVESLLRGYDKNAKSRDPSCELIKGDNLHFMSFVRPQFPQMAKMAEIQGDVVMSLSIDPTTGNVNKAMVVSGHPLLAESATSAARKWRLDPKTLPRTNPTVVTVRYSLNCP